MSNLENNITTVREWLGAGTINVFGMPFAGKDTQSQLISEKLGLGGSYLSSGQVLRDLKVSGDLPDDVRRVMDNGGLIPIADFVKYVMPVLERFSANDTPLVLSSVGRFDGEQQGVMEATNQAGHPTKVVVLLTIDQALARERWHQTRVDRHGQRDDDALESVKRRFKEFDTKTSPVLAYYQGLELLETIDGSAPENFVTEAIFAALAKRALANRVSTSP